jgi:hypothetical protein
MHKAPNDFWRELMSGRLNTVSKFFDKLRQQKAIDAIVPEASERFLNDPEDTHVFKAPERLKVGTAYFTQNGYLSQQDRADWQQTDARIQLFTAKMIEVFRKRGIPLYVHCAFRTREEQQANYNKGTSKAVWPRAPHCQGKAVDIVHSAYHWGLTPQEWQLIGKVGKDIARALNLELNWGGDWAFYDPAHWELSDWKDDIRKLQTETPKRITARGLLSAFKGG